MKRSYIYLAAGTLLIAGMVVAIVLPHHCYQIAVACDFHDLEGCGTFCDGAGLLVRVAVAAGGLILATAAWLVARRVPIHAS